MCLCLQQFEAELAGRQQSVDHCGRLCTDIMSRAHPDARSTLRYWQTTIHARWAEVRSLAEQKSRKVLPVNSFSQLITILIVI